MPPLRDGHEPRSGRLPSYRERSSITPTADAAGAFFWNAPRNAAHRFRVRNAASCVSTSCGDSLASAVLPNGLAASQASRTLDASDRLLPSHVFVRVPAPRWFPSVSWRSRAPRYGESPDSRQSVSLRWAPHAWCFVAVGVFHLPSQRVAAVPLVSLSRLPPVYDRSRGVDTT
jgi:hypothetical protein